MRFFALMRILPTIRRLLCRHPVSFRALAMVVLLLVVAGGIPRWVMHAVDAQHETLSAQSVAWDADEPHRDGDGDEAETHVCLHAHYFAVQPCTLPDALTFHVIAPGGILLLDVRRDAPDSPAVPPQRPPIA
ncbi:hypothetical protein BJI69_16930 [Luteibacter rhizovicinus DSM 16549]|uniref:Uncharacterized protein n=2 Tax=Luteibacter rhizovicinus TaxID=242606 RepID=A0A0G9HK16_9GAMM|nr:hypothetical protein BJI69_16930 [Luteibacter rhizovicinus DSM 16549]KLD68042.1 hypothetical protein Y883_05140 [Luteibacter rhizovicinus DSM 16549]KLD77264.1 hypothetical protein Y886_16700 [Xanthomonas hyacinthi DSM 19077]